MRLKTDAPLKVHLAGELQARLGPAEEVAAGPMFSIEFESPALPFSRPAN
jgi:hypothetical protein